MENLKAIKDKTLPDTDFEQLFEAFCSQLDNIIQDCWDASSEVNLNQLADDAAKLAEIILEIGDHCSRQLTDFPNPLPVHYIIVYEWADRAKGFLLLWRDILFEEQKASLKFQEGEVEEARRLQLTTESREVVWKASSKLKKYVSEKNKNENPLDKQLKQWEKQLNPWDVYREQIAAIPGQCKKIIAQYENLEGVSRGYRQIADHFNSNIENYQEILAYLITEISSIKSEISGDEDAYNGSRLVSTLENIQKKELAFKTVGDFNEKLDAYLDLLPGKQEISIDIDEGLLLFRELDIRRATSSWLVSETMSMIYDFYNIKNSLHDNLNLTILNIKNRVAFEKQEGQQPARKEIISALTNLLKTLEVSNEKIEGRQKQISDRTHTELKASNIYGPDFLSISMASTLNQYKRYQLEGWKKVRDWVQQKGLFVKKLQKYARQEDILSPSEKIVRVVRFRTPQPANSQYTNMFLTKGYIGDSFCVGRAEELQRIDHLVENWKLGFRGALLITGKRFSGKSFLGAMVSNRHFATKTIHIKPNTKIHVAGRHIEAKCDLEEVLDFVVKYSLQSSVMVWIDDLELWKDKNTGISDNARYLLEIIDQYSGRLFFAVSMSNWLRAQLDQFYEIDKVFQSQMNTDRMEIEDVKNAILIRHDATQMNLVDANGEKLDAKKLDKIVKMIYKAGEGNIGDVLRRWAYFIHKRNEDEVFPKAYQDYFLPDFLSTDASMLLRTIIMDKRSNEYLLRKRFGPAFKDHFQPFLQRFFNLGILKRQTDGSMEVNPFLVNEIGMLLEFNMTFSFQGNKTTSELIKI